MNRDTLKTVGFIVLIGAIVVVTFLYGNKQRQDQIRKEQTAKQQQSQQTAKQPPKVAPSTTANNAPGNSESGATPAAPQVSATTTPQTGGDTLFIIPVALIVGLYELKKSTKRSLRSQILNADN